MRDHTTHFDDCGCKSALLMDLLAVIHADGGHYVENHGVEVACADAAEIYYDLKEHIRVLEAENARLRAAILKAHQACTDEYPVYSSAVVDALAAALSPPKEARDD